MNLLLLLSALLSALTGVGGGVRAQDRAPTVAEGSIAVRRAPVAAHRATERPAAAMPGLMQVARGGIDQVFAPIAREPAFASRRRE